MFIQYVGLFVEERNDTEGINVTDKLPIPMIVLSQTVLEWDEFIAYRKRLDIPTVSKIIIELECGYQAIVCYDIFEFVDKEKCIYRCADKEIITTSSNEMFQWPEFRQLAKRLGIDMSNHLVKLIIEIDVDALVVIRQAFYATDTLLNEDPSYCDE